jgi:uncharacterized membrane protein
MNRWLFVWRKISAQIWVRASLYAVFGCVAALAAVFLTPWVPSEMADRLGGEAVTAILSILASSLLAVATFSLGAMVSAYTAVSQAASPRVAALVTSDETTQKSLATFVGAFLYAVVATTAVNAQYYGPEGRAVLFLTSLGVVVLVAFRLLAWINRLSSLARLSHMIERVEDETVKALSLYRLSSGASPDRLSGTVVGAPLTGYVQNIDRQALRTIAERHDWRIEVVATTGAFLRRDEPVCRLDTDEPSERALADIVAAFSLDRARTFAQDPRHGLIVLGEIGGKAMSTAVHDPGTAIAVVAAGVRIFDDWSRPTSIVQSKPSLDRLLEPDPECRDLLDDLFGPLVRFGLGDLQVAVRLYKALRSLGANGSDLAPAALALASEVAARARIDLPAPDAARFDLELT